MERRFLLFIVLAFAILSLHFMLTAPKQAPKKPPEVAAGEDGEEPQEGEDAQQQPPEREPPPEEPGEDPEPQSEEAEIPVEEEAEIPGEEQPEIPPQWFTLGSADPAAEYRMLVTLTNKGAAVMRTELNSSRYHDLEDRSGYIGHFVVDETAIDESLRGMGCPVQVVGPGTPAGEAGLLPGDLIKALESEGIAKEITGPKDFAEAMEKTRPNREIKLTIGRKNEEGEPSTKILTVTTRRRPLELIRPEGSDPLSFLVTLEQYGDQKLADQRKRDVCLARLFDDLKVRELALRELDVSDLNMAGGEIQIPRKEKQQWIALPDACQEALNEWLAVLHRIRRERGKSEGEDKGGSEDQPEKEDTPKEKNEPLFPSLVNIDRRLPVERIEAIIEQLSAPEKGSRDASLFAELDGLDLRTGNWEVVSANSDAAVFRRVLPKFGLEITKEYRLAKVPADEQDNASYAAFHLVFDVKVRNVGSKSRKVAYQLDGPTGLPDEGAWYANKVSRTWSMAGLRDVVVSFDQKTPKLITCSNIAAGKVKDLPWQNQSITYIGVDAQYFSVVMMPKKDAPEEIWYAESRPLRVGPVNEKMKKMTNTSCRLVSKTKQLEPSGEMGHQFKVFAGPKQPTLLAQYGLGELLYYGWFGLLAKPMSHILHVLYAVVRNYGLAIILLTVLVRGCMFPLSRKQALGAQKMQELQPEIKKIQEKYKKDMEGRSKAQQELFRKHNYNPLSGCLVVFVQLPIFIALYRSLIVDIELRQAPLISQSIRWCSNLAAPDMLYDWSGFMPKFVTDGVGFFGLGPYFNLLPILTIGLFIMQQKMFMPPPTDDQQAMQQKMMKYMMVFMGVIFFKVASGLCIYFIASSLWGLAEKQLLPKTKTQEPVNKTESRADAKARARAQAVADAKAKEKKAGGDGAAGRKKKKNGRGNN